MRSKYFLSVLLGLAAGIALIPASASAWWNDDWSMRKSIHIDTSATGANISDPIGAMPVLVRLHAGDFKFEAAKEDGSDLRFVASDDKTPLKHHVEKFDSLLGEAFVWVAVPDVKAGAKVDFWMYYGNSKAIAAEEPKGTFDTNTVLAYHFAERNLPARDFSAWGNVPATAGVTADGAMIGPGLRLDGLTALDLPASPTLSWTDGGPITWSAWIKPSQIQPNAIIFSRRDGVNAFAVGIDNGMPFVEVDGSSGLRRAATATPLAVSSWHHVAVTASGIDIVLYIDGVPAATVGAVLPALTGPSRLGGDVAAAAAAVAAPVPATKGAAPVAVAVASARPGFAGDIDELEIAKVARSAGYLKAVATEQGPDSAKILSMGPDEETTTWISGYFAVILKSVTLDGWVVIGILAVMALMSWLVMATKASYLSRQEKANERFLGLFHHVASDLTILDQGDDEVIRSMGGQISAAEMKSVRSSSLYRIYHIAAREIGVRMKDGRRRGLSSEAIASIRAGLDSGIVRESQQLSKAMVVLTIAISGGPFLGLLGTVVGVMITFAAIAASGDVNVNAIAPGIAAALVATVAGLAVAIPALFGYNWLLIRIKNANANMQIFVDELVTKMAEAYSAHGKLHNPTAAE